MVAAPAAVALERVSAHEVRIENIRTIGQVYNIFPQAESAPPIAASLRRRLDSLLAHHRPFGGREELLDALDALAADDATGYVFVTAGSGFGKTALLANWLLRSMATGGEPVYHFINRAEGVADEQFTLLNLCQQLVAAHGMSGQLPVLTAELRSLFSQLLMTPPPDESRLIIILDGLDEALGWTAGADMFPALANGIRVVFSARREADTHWLDRLRLAEEQVRVLELGPLSRADIARLLENAGARAAAHATNADTLESLHKASGGDPFYLRFLVEDLNRDSSGGIGAPGKSVAVQPPSGLRNYLEEWWNQLAVDVDIELEQAYDLLGLLTVAKGPLRVGELVGVLDTLRRGALLKRELGGKIRRYLVGSADDGYALCHTRFRAYLKEDVFDASEIDRYQTALLAFCERWRETGSAYALSYYPSHLIDLGQRDQLARLISREWLDARFTRDRSYRGFVADIELAAPVFFDLKTLDDFVQLCRLALVRATAVSLAASVPDDAIVALAASGRDEEAMAYVDLVGDRSRRMELLRCCGEAIAAAGDTVQGRYLIDMSHDIAETFEGAKLARSTALLAGAYTTVGDEATAQRLAQRALAIIATSPPDAYQTALVAQELTSAGCLDEARTALEAVNDPRTEPLARPHLIRALVASGRHDEALALARATPSAWRRVSQLVYVSGLLHASGAKEHAAVAARSISQLVEEQDWEWGQAPALAQAARALRLAGLLSEGDQMKERALALVARDQERKDLAASPFFTAWNTAGVVRGLAQAGDLLAAHALLEGLARGTPSADGRETHSLAMAAAWRGIAAVEAEQGNVNAAFECIEIIEQFEQVSDDGPWASTAWPTSEFPELPDDYHHSWWVRLDLIKRLAEAGFTADALSAASLLDSQSARDVARRDIVAALVDQGMLDQAREVTEAIESRADRVEALGKVAAKLAARGDIAAISWAERSIELGRMLYDPWSTSWTAFDAINGLISTGHVERASEAAAALTGADAKPWALIAIAQARLSMSEHVAAIASAEDALSAAREVTEEADPHEQVSIRVVVSAPDLQDAWVPLPTLRPDNPFKARSQLVGLARNAPNARFVGPWLMGVDSYAIALVMPSVVDVLVAAGEVERAAEAVQEVFDTAVRVQSRLGYGQWPVAQVCVELTRLGDLMRASRLVQGVGELFAASTRSAMADALLKHGRREEAVSLLEEAAENLPETRSPGPLESEVLAGFALTMARASQAAHAADICGGVEKLARLMVERRNGKLADLVTLTRITAPELANDLLSAGAADDAAAVDLIEVAIAMGAVDRPQEQTEVFDKARSAASGVKNPSDAADVYSAIARLHPDVKVAQACLEDAAALAHAFEDPDKQAVLLNRLTRAACHRDWLDRALELATTIEPAPARASALGYLSYEYDTHGRHDDAVGLAYKIHEIAATADTPADAAPCFAYAATALAYHQEWGAAISSLLNGMWNASYISRSEVFEALRVGSIVAREIGSGEALWQIHQEFLAIDAWWAN